MRVDGIQFYRCYAPPSLPVDEFMNFLDRLTENAKQHLRRQMYKEKRYWRPWLHQMWSRLTKTIIQLSPEEKSVSSWISPSTATTPRKQTNAIRLNRSTFDFTEFTVAIIHLPISAGNAEKKIEYLMAKIVKVSSAKGASEREEHLSVVGDE